MQEIITPAIPLTDRFAVLLMYYNYVFNACRWVARNAERPDLFETIHIKAQDKILQRVDPSRPAQMIKTWIFRVVICASKDAIRNDSYARLVYADGIHPEESAAAACEITLAMSTSDIHSVRQAAAVERRLDIIAAARKELSETDRERVDAYEKCGCSTSAAAALLGCAPSVVSKALAKLRTKAKAADRAGVTHGC